MAFRWQAKDGPTMNAGLVALCFFQAIRTSIAKKPFIFVIFQRQTGLHVPPQDSPILGHFVYEYIVIGT